MQRRCFLVLALAPRNTPAAEANRLLNEFIGDHSHGLPVYHDHFTRTPHGGVAVLFPRDGQEQTRLEDPGPLAGWQISIFPLVFSLTAVGFAAQTSFTLEQYGHTTLEQLIAEERPDKRYWWQHTRRGRSCCRRSAAGARGSGASDPRPPARADA